MNTKEQYQDVNERPVPPPNSKVKKNPEKTDKEEKAVELLKECHKKLKAYKQLTEIESGKMQVLCNLFGWNEDKINDILGEIVAQKPEME